MHPCSLVAAIALSLTITAEAGVYKCRGPNGRLSFSSRPCPEEQQQLEHRLSAEEKARQRREDEQTTLERRQPTQKPSPEESATQQSGYEKMMEKLAGQVYRGTEAEDASATEVQPESSADELIGDLVRNLERELVFEVEPGNSLDPVQNNLEDNSVPQVRRYLDNNLHAPKSLEVIEWGPVMKVVQFSAEDFSSWKEYRVRLKFRTKNRLGSYVQLDQVFILDEKGQMLRVVNFDGRPLADY